MAKNLVIDILLNNSNFSKNLAKCKTDLDRFKMIGGAVTGSIVKLAGTFGLAMGAAEAFRRTIRGCQDSSDKFDARMRACETSVHAFFTSLSSGDFGAFMNGLGDLIDRAQEANAALDQLGNTTISFDYFSSKHMADFEEQMAIARDKNNSPEVREAATKKAKEIQAEAQEHAEVLATTSINAVKNVVAEAAGRLSKEDFTIDDVETILSFDISRGRDSLKSSTKAEYEKMLKEEAAIRSKYTKYGYSENGETVWYDETKSNDNRVPLSKIIDKKGYEEELRKLHLENKMPILFNEILGDNMDDWLKNLTSIMMKYQGALRASSRMLTRANRTEYQVSNYKTGGSGSDEKKIGNLMSIAGLNETINELENKKNLSQSIEEINLLNKKIEALKTIRDTMAEGKPLTASVISGGNFEGKPTLPGFTPVAESPINFDGVVSDIDKLGKTASLMNNLSRSIRGVGNAMAATGNKSKDMARSIAVANATASIAMTIAQMAAIMTEKTKNSVTVWDWIAAATAGVATVVSLAAQLRSINTSKFATGGIVGGSSYSGDKIIAGVNSGEMILNAHQQKNLFNLLDKGGSIGSSSASVDFRISGRDLVGVLNNYNNKMSKVR